MTTPLPISYGGKEKEERSKRPPGADAKPSRKNNSLRSWSTVALILTGLALGAPACQAFSPPEHPTPAYEVGPKTEQEARRIIREWTESTSHHNLDYEELKRNGFPGYPNISAALAQNVAGVFKTENGRSKLRFVDLLPVRHGGAPLFENSPLLNVAGKIVGDKAGIPGRSSVAIIKVYRPEVNPDEHPDQYETVLIFTPDLIEDPVLYTPFAAILDATIIYGGPSDFSNEDPWRRAISDRTEVVPFPPPTPKN